MKSRKAIYLFGIIIALSIAIVLYFFNKAKNEPQFGPDRCVVTLFGKKYDVTDFRNTHEGGDVFECNTDMTVQFQFQHGDDKSRITRELGKK